MCVTQTDQTDSAVDRRLDRRASRLAFGPVRCRRHPRVRISVGQFDARGHLPASTDTVSVRQRREAPIDRLRYLGPFLFDRFDALAALRRSKAAASTPLLSLVSVADELVPRALSEEVHGAFTGEKSIVNVPGAYHENGWTRHAWSRSIVDFIERSLDNDLLGRG